VSNDVKNLGDGVSAEGEGDMVKLTAGVNVIYLEPEVERLNNPIR
jgi:hypothetical protein